MVSQQPPRKGGHKEIMRKDSVVIFSISVLITAAIVGSAYYMSIVRPTHNQTTQTRPEPFPDDQKHTGNPTSSQPAAPVWTDTPIRCFDEKVGEFWTNANNCDNANLENRLSIAEPLKREDYESHNASEVRSKTTSSKRAKKDRKPSLRLAAKSPPSGLNVPCKFAVGKALELERALSAVDEPRESIWREDYCKWRSEARKENCEVPRDLFYYNNLCSFRG
jgi:hypothetical protein